ncbi:ammonium transporter [Methanomethylophilus alvi]|uniref:ammonium transporter n=1 Tax=Methanomethylophilus alvi TaxID=1291540 RepID=UPI0037DCC9C2
MRKSFKMMAAAVMVLATAMVAMVLTSQNSAADTGSADSGSISWIMVSSALVFAMVPGLAFFYGGMLRRQSMSSMIAQTLAAISIMSISWIAVGYSLAFGSDGVIIGNLQHLFFGGLTEEASGGAISTLEFATFQMMFAIVTAALVLGACAERIRFNAIVWFLIIWSVLVYAPMAHWVWGGGWFDQFLTVLDFAGGTVVHICAGVTGLALCIFVGPRLSGTRKARAHSIPFAFLGAMLLWIGWFGFNGGSSALADGTAVHAFFTTQAAGACGMAAWAIVQYIKVGRVGVLGLIAGGISGLVAITPGAAYVGFVESMVIGAVGGALCFMAVRIIRSKTKFDDALDVFGVHGVGGIWGAISTGIFAKSSLAGVDGLIYGGVDLFVGQVVAVLATIVFCFAMSYAIIWLISKFMKVRIPEDEESIGQDIVEHGEPAYL